MIVKNFWSVINHVRVYSHHIPFHTALIASEPEIVNKTTRVLKVIHSLVHPLNRTRVGLEADRDHLFGCVSVPLFGPHLSVIAVFTPAQKIPNIYGYRHTSSYRQIFNIFSLLEPLNYYPDGGNGNFHCSSFSCSHFLFCEAQQSCSAHQNYILRFHSLWWMIKGIWPLCSWYL